MNRHWFRWTGIFPVIAILLAILECAGAQSTERPIAPQQTPSSDLADRKMPVSTLSVSPTERAGLAPLQREWVDLVEYELQRLRSAHRSRCPVARGEALTQAFDGQLRRDDFRSHR